MKVLKFFMFPSLVGRLKTLYAEIRIISIIRFPSLVGRLKTIIPAPSCSSFALVSIPCR